MSRLRLFITLPLLLVVVLFAVVNRAPVAVNFWPLPWATEVPLAAVAFAAFFLGAVSGGLAVWLGGMRKRRRERLRAAEEQAAATALESEPAELSATATQNPQAPQKKRKQERA